ncbi:MAG: 16S rRNA (uracil(1498)-N(3))-methyltransferase [Alphaproteobacteria bacterium]|nr:16S rRNA (uracil(1498)-N(3))-methyltransferase [Alphaproteobacteria bacterium]
MVVRLFVDDELSVDADVALVDNQHHYLAHVMRSEIGDAVLLFNGKDGEWSAVIEDISKKKTLLKIEKQTRKQNEENLSDVWLCFSLIKKENMHLIIQKATELGVSVLQPVISHRSVVSNVSVEKMRLQAIEAAEQSERLSVPQINEAISMKKMIENWDLDRKLYFLDERGEGEILVHSSKVAYLVGPEGGFDIQELDLMRGLKFATPLHFGRRILRAETACFAVLSVHNYLSGWH